MPDQPIIARKQQYEFADGSKAAKYEIFLKKNLFSLSPTYLGIVSHEIIHTDDGPMCRLMLTAMLDDPGLDIITECSINRQYIYFWRDCVWALGIDEHDKPLRHFHADFKTTLVATSQNSRLDPQEITIYTIGITPAWM